ncbi:MAG: transcriptional regulator [Parcubacteria group bacterium CG1_02_40_25]|nr:MAG: transcriptional regulator [Parcubacteria group bacterium CG1_02_40_25]
MSGHSKWSKVKWQKAITDAKKSKIFSKIARMISVAAKEKGPDPETNPKLRLAMEKARESNMPKDNVERAIKKGAGADEGAMLEEFIYEAYGPEGVALIIEGITDNKNRALGEIKNILSRHQGKLASQGSVLWLFDHIGILEYALGDNAQKDILELKAIEAGAQDIQEITDEGGAASLLVYAKPENLEKIKQTLEQADFNAKSFSLDWQAREPVEVKAQDAIDKLLESLDEQDDINEIYSNLK